jgi:hypothetical protein
LFGRGLPVSTAPGELIIEGSPLWEKKISESQEVHILTEFEAIVSVHRIDEMGRSVASLDYLHCEVQGGFRELRFTAKLPSELLTIGFSLDLQEARPRGN